MLENQKRAWVRSLRTIRLFFSSETRWKAITWFAALLSLLLALSVLNVVNSYVGRDFMTAISDRRWKGFVTYAIVYLGRLRRSRRSWPPSTDSRRSGSACSGAPG